MLYNKILILCTVLQEKIEIIHNVNSPQYYIGKKVIFQLLRGKICIYGKNILTKTLVTNNNKNGKILL